MINAILNYFFNLLHPRGKRNWLSVRYHRWETKRKEEFNERVMNRNREDYEHFTVPGAGIIQLSKTAHVLCGGSCGFSFAVDWGRYGMIGGVLGREEAKRMANIIITTCSGIQETEAEEVGKWREEAAKRRIEWEMRQKP